MKQTSRSLSDLTPETHEKCEQVIAGCKARGVDLLVYCTFRSLTDQAELFRHGRTSWEIRDALQNRRPDERLVKDLINAESIPGARVTNALPGYSFHQYGEAFDAAPMKNGKILWMQSSLEWQIYGDEVRKAGLFWAGDWKGIFVEFPHSQLRAESNPLKVYTTEQAVAELTKIGALDADA